ncbi:MAG: agmatinase, partial [Actinobacteria bacterium]|nr:agmatinase [Actinomycetota bacterium]
ASRHLRPAYHPDLEIAPFRTIQAVDAGDVPCNPFDIDSALKQINEVSAEYISDKHKLVTFGGDHTITLGILRSMVKVHGPLAVVHFDAHLDTWNSYFGADRTHGTFLRRAFEEGLLVEDRSMHVGIRGPLYDKTDLDDDKRFGFRTVRASDFDRMGVAEVIGLTQQRVGDQPYYLSIDIDVLDPAFAPGTGTPEMGGFTSRELLSMVRALPRDQMVGADVVEVAPAYDHAEITSLAAATLGYEIMSLMALSQADK